MASNDWKKMTIYDAGGMNRHNGKYERENGNHSNRHIDKSKSHLNLYIGCDDYSEACHNMKARVQEVDKLYPPKRKNKSDTRIICTMIVVPCPQEICERGYDATKQFFYDMYQLYKNFFGADNVHGGMVHFDEIHEYTDKDGTKKMSLPHMHTLISAYSEWTERDKKTGATITRKGINGKHFETKARMKKLNQIVEDYCLENFGIHFLTGESPQKKSVERLKSEEELHQLTAKKKQIQTELAELEMQKQQSHQSIEELISKKNEMQHLIEEQSVQLAELKEETTTRQEESESLKKKIDEMQQEILDITLPPKPVPPTKPREKIKMNRKDYIQYRLEDIPMNFFERKKEEARVGKEYDTNIQEWENYEKALEQYKIDYENWATATKTVKALQERLNKVNSYEESIRQGQRAIFFAEELKMKKQINELKQQNETLQTELDTIHTQIQTLADNEYQRRRKRDAELLAYYEQYSGIPSSQIENAVKNQHTHDLTPIDYHTD